MLVLRLLGGASLESADGAGYSGPSLQRHRIALLAILVTSRSRALPRETLMELLWPERNAEQVRRLLNQSVYVLRSALGEDAIVTVGDALRLNASAVHCDVVDFEEAVAAGALERASRIYTGPFLDGFHLNEAPELEHWIAEERSRLAGLQAKALLGLAESAQARGDLRSAAEWLKALIAHQPSDSSAVLRLMRVLESAGDPPGALLQAAAHERLLREELGVGLPPDILAAVTRLRAPLADRDPARPAGHGESRPAIHVAVQDAAPPREAGSPSVSVARPSVQRLAAYGAVAFLLVAGALAWRWWGANERPDPGVTDPALRDDTRALPPARRTTSIAAYELYVRGNDPAVLRDDAAARQALEYLRQAVELDPAYAAAWVGLARLTMRTAQGELGDVPRAEARSLAQDAIDRALELDDSIAEAHALQATLQLHDFDFTAAEISFNRAIALDPSLSLSRQWRITLYLWTARPAEALAEAERAAALDPVSPAAQAEVARVLGANGRCREALARLERLESVKPPLLRVAPISAECKGQLQMWQGAIDALRAAPGDPVPLNQALLGYLLARAGERGEALRVLEALRERRRTGRGGAFPVAVVHAGLGDRDEALAWLARAIDDGSLAATNIHFTILLPVLEVLAGDPRIEQLAPLSALARAGRLGAQGD
ncbi:MAG TPA: BTAD domain-containing putative transcriptional regulator [Steroidobacteraceae bacterium]|nr:BTAD domain-containing putative transcriptional regulator [Steroidobacteraceae bacterium]